MVNAKVEAIDFEPEYDDLMDEEVGDGSPSRAPASFPRLKSAITGGGLSTGPKRTKGHGFRDEAAAEAERNACISARFESFDSEGGPGPERSIEGWIILVTGVHEEAQEDHLRNSFDELGEIKNIHLNFDRRTGSVKGYALIEYENFDEAQRTVNEIDGTELLGQTINVDWAFIKVLFRRRSSPPRRQRSMSPRRRF